MEDGGDKVRAVVDGGDEVMTTIIEDGGDEGKLMRVFLYVQDIQKQQANLLTNFSPAHW